MARLSLTSRFIPVWVWVALIVVFAATRLVLGWVLPHEALSIALDEGTYAELVGMMARGTPVEQYGSGWGAALYPATRAFLLPAGGFASVGADPYVAVRATAVVYGALAQLVLLMLLWLHRDSLGAVNDRGAIRLVSWQSLGMALLLLVPSHAVWGTLGLKDSASEFWAVLTVLLTVLCLRARFWRARLAWAVAVAVSIALVFQVRDYIGAAVIVGVLAIVVWRRDGRFVVAAWLAVGALAGGAIGTWAVEPLPPASSAASSAASSSASSSASASVAGPVGPTTSGVRGCATIGVEALSGAASCGATVRDKMAENANSAFGDVVGAHGSGVAELQRLPGAVVAVLFRPIWPIDESPTGSVSFWLASLENYLWLGLALVVGFALLALRTPVARITTFAVVYMAVLIGGLAVFEGNLGTAFRHKGQLLWAVAVVFVLTGNSLRPWARRLLGGRSASNSDPGIA